MIVCDSMKESEVDRVFDLIVRVFQEHVAPAYSDKGVDKFLGILSPDTLRELDAGEGSLVIVARRDGEPVGMLALREEKHVALVFVESHHQGKGIGKGLIDEAIKICRSRDQNVESMTVNSSPNSISFYESLGFRPQGEEVDDDGIRYVPMEKSLA